MTSPPTDADRIACPQCGAACTLDAAASAAAACGFCGATLPLAAELLARRRAAAAQVAEAAARQHAAVREGGGFAEAVATQRHGWAKGVALALGINAAVITIGFAWFALWRATGLSRVLGDGTSVLGLIVTVALVGGGYFVWAARNKPAPAAPAHLAARCATCGAPIAFAVGEMGARCRHCAAAAVASPAMERQMIAVADRAAFDAELVRARAERQMYRGLVGARETSVAAKMAIGWSVLFPAVALGVFGIGSVVEGGRAAREGWPALALAAGWFTLVASIAVVVWSVRAAADRARADAFEVLAARFRGEVRAGGAEPALDWLDAHWPGPTPPELLPAGRLSERRWTLALPYAQRAALLVVVHARSRRDRSIHILLASPDPSRREADVAPSAARDALALGFTARLAPAGVHLAQRGSGVAALDPARMERALRVAQRLADSPRHAAGAPALDVATADDLLRQLIEAGVFSMTDLAANRAGRVSARQKRGGALRLLAAAGIATALFGWAVHVGADHTMRDRNGKNVPDGERYIGAALYALFGAAALGYGAWVIRAYTSPVLAVEGPATLGTEAGRSSLSHFCTVQGARFQISEPLAHRIVTGAAYRVYCSARGQVLLSLEPLRSA